MTHPRTNAFDVVRMFEDAVQKYTGAPIAVAVDSCTMALFLSMKWLYMLQKQELERIQQPVCTFSLSMPRKTFVSVPTMAIHAGWCLKWRNEHWAEQGYYRISTTHTSKHLLPRIYDSALWFSSDMYRIISGNCRGLLLRNSLVCLSFQYRKHLPIGRGGMILCDDPAAADYFRKARFFGRSEVPAHEEPGPLILGYHGYMEPERAATGLSLLMNLPEHNQPLQVTYPDVSKYPAFGA